MNESFLILQSSCIVFIYNQKLFTRNALEMQKCRNAQMHISCSGLPLYTTRTKLSNIIYKHDAFSLINM